MMERDDELEVALDDEVQLEVDEAVAASEDDGSIAPSGVAFLPLVPLREIVIFPEMVAPLKVGRDKSVSAVRLAEQEGWIALVTQRNPEQEEVTELGQLHAMGTLAKIAQVVNLQDGTLRAVVQGQKRIRILDLDAGSTVLMVKAEVIEAPAAEGVEVEALMKTVQSQVETYVTSGAPVPPEAAVAAKNISDPGLLADMTAYTPDMSTEQRQELLETIDVVDRLKYVSSFLARQIEILAIKGRIQSEVKSEMDKSQREYFLREQLKAIQRELGEDDPQQAEANELREKVEAADMPEEVKSRALKELDRMSRIPSASPEVGVIRTYVDWLIAMPWSVATEDRIEIPEAAKVLGDDHYGLEKVKERIIEYLAVRKLAPQVKSPILCFAGPPGVGKTSLGKSIAKAMGRKFVRMSLGGLHDEAEIRGHRRTYIGALPGRIAQGIKTAGTKNPVFMLDEIDKVGADFRGDPSAALLEVLDPEQNATFQDNYLEVEFDLSQVLFVATANQLDTIPDALRDRMEIIQIPGYTEAEKVEIAKRYLVPKQRENHGLKEAQSVFPDDSIVHLIRYYTREAGVRNAEREIATLMRKIARSVAEKKSRKGTIDAKKMAAWLGPERHEYGELESADQVGSATGLVVTPVGGDVVTVEVGVMEGPEELILTGQLGDVMKESARAALTWIKAHGAELGIAPERFEKSGLHIHVPAGAIPKDGPSAGITLATSLVSALTKVASRRDVAMTGEITLRGRVLPIGGLKEKLLAALKAGIKKVMIPEENVKDLAEIPDNVKSGLEIVPVARMDDVLQHALVRMPEAINWDEEAEEAAAAARAAADKASEGTARAH